jgi:hypothetical protein
MPEDTNFQKIMAKLASIETDIHLMRGESWKLFNKIEVQEGKIEKLEDFAEGQMSPATSRVVLAEIEGIKKDRRVMLSLIGFAAVVMAALKWNISVENGKVSGFIGSNEGLVERLIQAGAFGTGGFSLWAVNESRVARKRVEETKGSVSKQQDGDS